MEERPSSGDVDIELVQNLRLLVDEEAFLWEAARVTTRVTPTSIASTGPFDPAACAEVLGRWLSAGLIGVYRREQDQVRKLDVHEAFLAISRWELWGPGDSEVCLYETDRGAEAGDDRWIGVLRQG